MATISRRRKTQRSRRAKTSRSLRSSAKTSRSLRSSAKNRKPLTIRLRTTVKPRLTRKAGFTKWQVDHQSVGIGPLRKGKLEGYHTSSTKAERTSSLNKAVKVHGALSTYRSLNALAVYNKNRSPEVSAIAKADRDMIKDKYL